MLIDNGDGTYTAGQADLICILELPTHTFHAAFFEEHPLPSQSGSVETQDFLRLKSKIHHTEGSPTLEGAQVHLDNMRTKLRIPDSNVIRDRAIPVSDPVNIWILPNWLKEKKAVTEVIKGALI